MIFGKRNREATDNELMQQIVAGDQTSFGQLYHRYKDRMYYYFYRMLGNSPELANDFLQELFMKLVEKPESFNPKFSFSTWFYSVANNMCKNEYRRREVRNEFQAAEAFSSQLDYPTEASVEPEQLIGKVFATLEEMGEEHRSAFLLRYREGFSISDVAEILGLPEGTVKSRLFYARKVLAEKLNYLREEIEF